MKANKLMIGDWVEVISNDHLKHVQITEIYQNSILTKESEFESEEVSIDNIKPIPLTPEILEKNGFYLEKYTGACMSGYWWIRNDFVIHKSMIDSVGRNNFKYNYVHDLQHALNLCGIEKTIEL